MAVNLGPVRVINDVWVQLCTLKPYTPNHGYVLCDPTDPDNVDIWHLAQFFICMLLTKDMETAIIYKEIVDNNGVELYCEPYDEIALPPDFKSGFLEHGLDTRFTVALRNR